MVEWLIRVEGGPSINHVKDLEQSKRDKWPDLPSAFRLWIFHYRMRGASHLYTVAQQGRDRPPHIHPSYYECFYRCLWILFAEDCDTRSSVCNLHQHAVLACLLKPPINASMLNLFLSFCFCCHCKIMSSISKGKRKTQKTNQKKNKNNRKLFQKQVMYRWEVFFSQTVISVFRCRYMLPAWKQRKRSPVWKDYTKGAWLDKGSAAACWWGHGIRGYCEVSVSGAFSYLIIPCFWLLVALCSIVYYMLC